MAPEVRKYTFHIFVCLNERPAGHPRGSCKEKNAEAVLAALKKEVVAQGLAAEVRAQKAGCLDTCEWGVSLVVYPQNIWYGRVTPDDAAEIILAHRQGKCVERLRIPGK